MASLELLLAKALEARKAYYDGNPTISDTEYDKLIDSIRDIDPHNSFLYEVGDSSNFKTEVPYYMTSLRKPAQEMKYSEKYTKFVTEWVHKFPGPYDLSHKLDGVSGQLVVQNGRAFLYSRGGDSKHKPGVTMGLDLSGILKYISGIPKKLPQNCAVRGELIISISDFNTIETDSPPLAYVSGLVRNSAATPQQLAMIHFVTYYVYEPANLSKTEQYQWLASNGFETVGHISVDAIDSKLISTVADEFLDDPNLQYECDGVVIDTDRFYPLPPRGDPESSFAYKRPPKSFEVTVTTVKWKWGLNRCSPTVHFTPFTYLKKKYEKVSGINGGYMYINKVGPGAKILISVNVVPIIVGVVSPSFTPSIPEGQLGVDYVWSENKDGKFVHLVRPDGMDETPESIQKRLLHFCRQLDIKGFGESHIKTMYSLGYKTISALLAAPAQAFPIYNLSEKLHHAVNNSNIANPIAATIEI